MSREGRKNKTEVEYDFTPMGEHLDLTDALQRLNGKQHVLGRLFKTFSTRYENARVEFDQPLAEERWSDLKDEIATATLLLTRVIRIGQAGADAWFHQNGWVGQRRL